MSSSIDAVQFSDAYPNVLVVQDMNGAKRYYLEYQGTYIPGRIAVANSPESYAVHLFLPYMDGLPTVLKVVAP